MHSPRLFLAVMLLPQAVSAQTGAVTGTWRLISRTDSGARGVVPADGDLGSDPVALLIYDRAGNVSAQLMARRREAKPSTILSAPSPSNNSAAVGGYDAYFGQYTLDTIAHTVTHQLIGALSLADVGRQLTRHYAVSGDTLRLSFETHRVDGQLVLRRLAWVRVDR